MFLRDKKGNILYDKYGIARYKNLASAEAKDIKTVKVWLDLTNPKIFELDINDLFNKVGSSYQIVYEGRMVYTDKAEADSMIKFLTDRRY